eukprot:TRINITY_DN12310_c0_g1_i1.p1 TRINITY_DN12310_c0_g1~~TRINITY_DN12310_c0_g1_i1.p1  ORF type:complete len:343 (+),score=91.88 TRINITY_DN12310_c0_g1_i1:64-1092(+)
MTDSSTPLTNEVPGVLNEDEAPELSESSTAKDIEAATERVERAKEISKEKFMVALKKVLVLAIDGYPRALRSTLSKRNELLRLHGGDQDSAAEDIKAQAADVKEETKTWLIGCVPFVGLPAKVLYPAWRALRRVALLAGTFGLDLDADVTRAKILHAFAGLRGAALGEFALEAAVQLVWSTFAGPAAFLPVGVLASKVANVEGIVMTSVGRETFAEDRRPVTPEEYEQELDAEPTSEDYLGLCRDSALYGLLIGKQAGDLALAIARDRERRGATAKAALSAASAGAKTAVSGAKSAAGTAVVLGKGAVAAAPGAAEKVEDKVKDGLMKGLALGKAVVGGAKK